ncbi:MAG: tyrosine-type recombinase/integrase [Acetobacteraceae bacterium]
MELLEASTSRGAVAQATPAQADSDGTLIALWLAGKAGRTCRAYQDDLAAFQRFTDKPLCQVTLADLVAYGETLSHFAPASRARKLGALKSLASFGHRIGYLTFDIGAPLRLPAVKSTLAERILGEGDVHRLLTLETHPRNHALLRLLYAGALRVSELCSLTWRDLRPRDDAGQVAVFGKGGKTRVVLLTPGVWSELTALRGGAGDDDPVFRSRKGGHLTPVQVHRVVKGAAARAGISPAVSAHWLRHAHASHALDRGAPVSLVQATLGHASVATTGRYLHARPNDSSARYLPE